MSCICQYIISSSSSTNGGGEPIAFPLSNANDNSAAAIGQEGPCDASMEPVTDDTKIAVCVSELADCRSENWLLKKKLEEHEVTIQNLEHLMTTIMNKQHKMLAEVLQLRKRNQELQNECNLQREYHAMERNALIKEIYDLKNRDQMCALSAEDESNSSMNSQEEYGEQIETDSDEAKLCYEHDSDGVENEEDGDDGEDEHSAGSSAESSAPSSHNGSMYSADSDTYETDESEDEEQESQHEQEEYSTDTESESD